MNTHMTKTWMNFIESALYSAGRSPLNVTLNPLVMLSRPVAASRGAPGGHASALAVRAPPAGRRAGRPDQLPRLGQRAERPACHRGVPQTPHRPDANSKGNTGERNRRGEKKTSSVCCSQSLIGFVRSLQTPGSEDWRAELLEAVRQVFVRERSLLKSALYSQLDLLDTNDAIVHLNQLESRLVEQVRSSWVAVVVVEPFGKTVSLPILMPYSGLTH